MSARRIDRIFGLFALLISAASSAFAQQDDGWIGKRVITKSGTALKVGRVVVDDQKRQPSAQGGYRGVFRIYRVEKINGPWLWLAAENEGVSGWTKVEQVIPFDQAIDYLTSELRAKPNSWVYLHRGIIWMVKCQYDKAIVDFNDAIRLKPTNEVAWMNRGIVWDDKKEYDKAIADYDEAIRLDPKYASAYHNRGDSWRLKKEYDKALADYNEAIRLDPKNSHDYECRAWLWATACEAKARDGRKAVESAIRACELTEWKGSEGLDALAAAFAEMGDFDAAMRWQEKAIELAGKDYPYLNEYRARLELYRNKKPYHEGEEVP